MQEFWATAIVHHHSIRFKMNNKKHIANLEYFRKMLQICPRIPNQQFDELPFEEAILTFLRELGHSYDTLRLSQARILWGTYHKKNVDFAYLMWEDFVYQVEHKDAKKSNKMYYPRFTKVILNFFMSKDQSIPMRNKVNWHFARDNYMFTTIKLVSRHQNTQHYGAILSIELTNEVIRNFESYKEYYSIALGAEPPKKKASVKKKQSSSDTTMPPPTAKGKRLKTSAKVDKPTKEKQLAKTYKAKDEGTSIIPRLPDVLTYESGDEEVSWKSSEYNDDDDEVNICEQDEDVDNQSDDNDQNDEDDNDQDDDDQNADDDEQTNLDNSGDDFIHLKFSTHDDEDKKEERFDPIVQTPFHDEKTNDKDSHGMNVEGDEMDNE
nr:hypothetical protein [Tanacetum cinerariifolium]